MTTNHKSHTAMHQTPNVDTAMHQTPNVDTAVTQVLQNTDRLSKEALEQYKKLAEELHTMCIQALVSEYQDSYNQLYDKRQKKGISLPPCEVIIQNMVGDPLILNGQIQVDDNGMMIEDPDKRKEKIKAHCLSLIAEQKIALTEADITEEFLQSCVEIHQKHVAQNIGPFALGQHPEVMKNDLQTLQKVMGLKKPVGEIYQHLCDTGDLGSIFKKNETIMGKYMAIMTIINVLLHNMNIYSITAAIGVVIVSTIAILYMQQQKINHVIDYNFDIMSILHLFHHNHPDNEAVKKIIEHGGISDINNFADIIKYIHNPEAKNISLNQIEYDEIIKLLQHYRSWENMKDYHTIIDDLIINLEKCYNPKTYEYDLTVD